MSRHSTLLSVNQALRTQSHPFPPSTRNICSASGMYLPWLTVSIAAASTLFALPHPSPNSPCHWKTLGLSPCHQALHPHPRTWRAIPQLYSRHHTQSHTQSHTCLTQQPASPPHCYPHSRFGLLSAEVTSLMKLRNHRPCRHKQTTHTHKGRRQGGQS